MFIPWDEWIADPQRSELTKRVVLARALYWFDVARHQLEQEPSSAEWLEPLADCCASLHVLLDDSLASDGVNVTDDGVNVGIALRNALKDLRNGIRPDWMTPTSFPPSKRPASHKDRQLRALLVSSAGGLVEMFGFGERRACRTVIDELGVRTAATAEALRGWLRSREYDAFSDLVEAVGMPDSETVTAWLAATVRAFDAMSKYPGAAPLTR